MSLTDFWDNITRPGFWDVTKHDFSELCEEIKEDAQQLVEECEELLTHGANNMFEDTSDFKTTVDQRESADSKLREVYHNLLTARGLDGHWHGIINRAADRLESVVDMLTKDGDTEKSVDNPPTLEGDKQIDGKTPDEFADFAARLRAIITTPAMPSYEEPEPKRSGPLGLSISDKKEREEATGKYLAEIAERKAEARAEITRLKEQGPLFDASLLSGAEDLLESFCEYIGKYCPPLFSRRRSIVFCHNDEQDITEDEYAEQECKRRHNAVLAAIGICALLETAVVSKSPLGKEQYADLLKLNSFLVKQLEDGKPQENEEVEDNTNRHFSKILRSVVIKNISANGLTAG